MAYYNPLTRSKHNMYDMASLLQKAVRRGEYDRAGYAAYEMYENFHKVMWNRMLTISSEDCWGIITKELVQLRRLDEQVNKDRASRDKDMYFVSKAIALLCRAKKSRDACYFACNFILAENPRTKIELEPEYVESRKRIIERIPDEIFNLDVILSDDFASALPEEEQMSLTGEKPKSKVKKESETASNGQNVYEVAALLQKAVRICDMENIGYAANALRAVNRLTLWKTLLASAVELGSGQLTKEIISLKLTDDMVNGRKKPEARDEIFISKSLMLLCYEQTGLYESLVCNPIVDPVGFVNWALYDFKPISDCYLVGGIIPDWVYDVHTIRGKREGKTDWGMNLVEQEALNPLQVAFFDEGSWAPRYDYKVVHKMCSDLEYQMSLEYRKTHPANPAARLDESRWQIGPAPDSLDRFSRMLYDHMNG